MKGLALSVALVVALIVTATSAAAATYSIAVKTDSQAYTGASAIHLSGQVSPAPGPGTAVLIRIFNPNRVVVTADEAPVNGTTGLYSDTVVAGGSPSWVNGNYLVNVTWGAYPPVVFVTTPFSWSSTTTTTSTTSSTSTTSTSTSTTSMTSATSSTSSTSKSQTTTTTTSSSSPTTSTSNPSTSTSTTSGGGGGIPEFPYQALSVGLFSLLLVASYLVITRGVVSRGRGQSQRGSGAIPTQARDASRNLKTG